MKVYCAETGSIIEILTKNTQQKLPKFNILMSYYYYPNNLEKYVPYSKNIMVDSGAFTLQRTKNPDYDEFFERYISFVEKHHNNPKISGFFELDIHEKVGYDKVKEYRKRLFDVTPNIIPVWHKSLGLSEYKQMCKEHDYIGVSCVRDRSINKEDYIKFVKYAHQHHTKIHGLGMLRPKILNKVPFDSVDGTGWYRCSRFGKLGNKKVKSKYIKENRTKLAILELLEHIRFQEKMYDKWKNYHND